MHNCDPVLAPILVYDIGHLAEAIGASWQSVHTWLQEEHPTHPLPPPDALHPPRWLPETIQPWIAKETALCISDPLYRQNSQPGPFTSSSVHTEEETANTPIPLSSDFPRSLTLSGIASLLDESENTVSNWHHNGHPHLPLPPPNRIFSDGPVWDLPRIGPWLAAINQPLLLRVSEALIPQGTTVGTLSEEIREQYADQFAKLGIAAANAPLDELGDIFPNMVRTAIDLNFGPGWLVDAAHRLASGGYWKPLRIEKKPPSSPKNHTGIFCQGLKGIQHYKQGYLEKSTAELSAALRSPVLSGKSRSLIEYYHVRVNCDLGMYRLAAIDYQKIVQENGPYAKYAYLHLGELDCLAGRFRDALSKAAAIDPDPETDPFFYTSWKQLLGHAHRCNGLLSEAEKYYAEALENARQAGGGTGAVAQPLAHLASTIAWKMPSKGRARAIEAIKLSQAAGNPVHECHAHIALAIADAAPNANKIVQEHIQNARNLAEKTGYRRGEISIRLTEAFQAILSNKQNDAVNTLEWLKIHAEALGISDNWVSVVEVAWLNQQTQIARQRLRDQQWVGGPRAAAQRWHEILEARRPLA